MNLWEEAYFKHKEGGRSPIHPEVEPNHQLDDSPDNNAEPTAYRSFEEMYYWNARKPQTYNRRAQDPEQKPNGPVKEMKSRFTPRMQSSTLSPSYPAMLSKMHDSLSDTWSNILVGSDQDIKTLLVCGAARKEGTTFISYHLAMFLSKEYSMRVLYVDTNLNHTPIPKIQNLPGLYSYVSEGEELASLVLKTEYPGLYLLPSGAGIIERKGSSNLLTRESIETLIKFCRNNFDITIIDGQPITASPIMIEFAKKVDMAILVCRYGVSRQEVSKLAIDKLINCKTKSVGVVLNDRQFPIPQMLYRIMG
jgi:Mrp family chromosome partitioning ATPase